MRSAHGRSSAADAGVQTKILSRLAVRDRACGAERPFDDDFVDEARHTHLARVAEAAVRLKAEDVVLGRGAGALDERDRDLVHAGGDLHGYLREPLHDLGARRCAAAVHEVEILAAAELRAEHLIAVEENHGRVLALERARIEADVEVRDRDAVLAVGQESCA